MNKPKVTVKSTIKYTLKCSATIGGELKKVGDEVFITQKQIDKLEQK